MDCSLLHFSIHGISQARILEWVVFSSSRGSSPSPGDLYWQADFSLLSHLGSPSMVMTLLQFLTFYHLITSNLKQIILLNVYLGIYLYNDL